MIFNDYLQFSRYGMLFGQARNRPLINRTKPTYDFISRFERDDGSVRHAVDMKCCCKAALWHLQFYFSFCILFNR